MTLISAWIDSLTLLKPKNLQLFAMVTLKSIMEACKLLLKYWWWLFIVLGACYAVALWTRLNSSTSDLEYYAGLGSRWLYQLLFFATCLATRPSVEQKDCAYFRSHMYAFIYMIIFLAIVPTHLWPTAFSVWPIFLILFFLDSEGGPKNFFFSMWYALKMIIFNYPLLAVMGICFYLPAYILSPLITKAFLSVSALDFSQAIIIAVVIKDILSTLVLPIGVCTYANIYIKKLHDQFDLYNKQPQG